MPKQAIYIGPAPWAHDDSEGRARARPRIAIGIFISLLVHGLLFYLIPKPLQVDGMPVAGPMQVTLNAASAPPKSAPEPTPVVKPKVPPRRTIAVPSKGPSAFVVPIKPPEAPRPTPMTPPSPDQPQSMAELVARRQAQRAAEEAAAARFNAAGRAAAGDMSGDERRAANLASNLASINAKAGTNGIFSIIEKGQRTARFSFREWTSDASNSKRRIIEVDAGLGGDVELAIVRRMIELIREHYDGDFNWESQRLGRVITMSARKKDSAELERFLMREFDFGGVR